MTALRVAESLDGVWEVSGAVVAVEVEVAVDVVVVEAVGVAEFDDRAAVAAAEVARGGLEVVVAFVGVLEGLAAFSAPDRRRLRVLVGMLVEFCGVFECFVA